jgi:hypothetical protein
VTKTNLDEIAVFFQEKITAMKTAFDNQLKTEEEVCLPCSLNSLSLLNRRQIAQKDKDSYEEKIEELEKQLTAETHTRRLLETQLLQEKREAETRLREALGQVSFLINTLSLF